jgi:hypothetical protein
VISSRTPAFDTGNQLQEDLPMTRIFTSMAVMGIAMALGLTKPVPANAYQIDCAILLCLAGGFPPSAPCAAARAEMIRRITPWPIEPPLQIWRCPIQAGSQTNLAHTSDDPISIRFPSVSRPTSDTALQFSGLISTAKTEVKDYLAAIRVYDLSYRQSRNRDGDCIVSSRLRIGRYDAVGNFDWNGASVTAIPQWLFRPPQAACGASFRGVGLEWQDYEGKIGTEVVRY